MLVYDKYKQMMKLSGTEYSDTTKATQSVFNAEKNKAVDAAKVSAEKEQKEKENLLQGKQPTGVAPVLTPTASYDAVEKLAKILSTQDRRNLKASTFAVPSSVAKKEEPKDQQPAKGVKGKYPMPDKAHAVSAVSYVQRFGTQKEKEMVFAKAKREFGVEPHKNN